MRVDFHPSPRASLGIEWEIALVDAVTGELIPVAETVLAALRPEGASDNPRIKPELLLNTVELCLLYTSPSPRDRS